METRTTFATETDAPTHVLPCCQIDQPFSSVDQKVDAFQVLIEQLPLANQYLLLYLLDMLAIFVTTSQHTKMDSDCLSAVFVPVRLSGGNQIRKRDIHS